MNKIGMNKKRILSLTFALGLIMGAAQWFASHETLQDDERDRRATQSNDFALRWKKAAPQNAQDAKRAIVAQLEAFKKDDWATAQQYQSAGLRANFGSIENFRNAIENSYPQFANYKTARFFNAVSMGDAMRISIEITGMDGVKQKATYLMNREKDGWKVGGVRGGLVPSESRRPAQDAGGAQLI